MIKIGGGQATGFESTLSMLGTAEDQRVPFRVIAHQPTAPCTRTWLQPRTARKCIIPHHGLTAYPKNSQSKMHSYNRMRDNSVHRYATRIGNLIHAFQRRWGVDDYQWHELFREVIYTVAVAAVGCEYDRPRCGAKHAR